MPVWLGCQLVAGFGVCYWRLTHYSKNCRPAVFAIGFIILGAFLGAFVGVSVRAHAVGDSAAQCISAI